MIVALCAYVKDARDVVDPSFARSLRDRMQRLGLSVSDLAVICEVTTSTIYKWLRGYRPNSLTRQAVLYRLDQTKEFRYTAKEIEDALRAYRSR